jgi:hypothetical protein
MRNNKNKGPPGMLIIKERNRKKRRKSLQGFNTKKKKDMKTTKNRAPPNM